MKEPIFRAIILFRLCDGENSRGRLNLSSNHAAFLARFCPGKSAEILNLLAQDADPTAPKRGRPKANDILRRAKPRRYLASFRQRCRG
jgi:hypothetical protein